MFGQDQETVNRIKKLKQIKPDQNWVVLTKSQIIGQEIEIGHRSLLDFIKHFTLQYRVALAGLLIIGFSGGVVVASRAALPGQPLYSIKKITEKGMAMVNGQDGTAAGNLQLAARRLEEIDLISRKNLIKNLPVAFEEYKTAKTAAKKEVAALVRENPSQAGEIVKQVSPVMKNIDEKEKQVYGVLGLEENASSTDDNGDIASDKVITESLIKYFKKNVSLPEEQARDLAQVKEYFEAGDYGKAIDYYLSSSLNR